MDIVLKWIVIDWKKLWRQIWFPTANIKLAGFNVDDWTYKINIVIEWKIYSWAWSANNEKWLFESNIFDFNKDIYWDEIEVVIIKKIRDNIKFESIENLKKQINNDVNLIKKEKNYILTFWTFDLVHEWHKHFLNEAKKYWNVLVTILATDKNVEKFKWKKPFYSSEERKEHIKELNISDIISTWDEISPLKWIEMYMPNYICLWYDQVWFSDKLNQYIKEKKLKIKVIRLKPFKENIYKSSILKKKKKPE